MMNNINYLKAPAGWSHKDKNPFTQSGDYGPNWSCFCVLDRDDDLFITGRGSNGLFSARLGKGVDNLENRLADFLRYENAHGRHVILSFPGNVDIDVFVNKALSHTPAENIVRENDPEVIVHSTNLDAWNSILDDGELKAASRLIEEGRNPGGKACLNSGELSPVERYYANEPPEYTDYIMFGSINSTEPEMVLASRVRGNFFTEDDAPYEPGVRLYFDNHRIIKSNLGTRDGMHIMKVFNHLPLTPFLITAISVADIDPKGKILEWTPRTFVEKANSAFRLKFVNV